MAEAGEADRPAERFGEADRSVGVIDLAPRRQAPGRRTALVSVAAIALALAALAGSRLIPRPQPGVPELQAQLVAPNDPSTRAAAEVTMTGIGRVISFEHG
ncbi:MAG: hypothetical protein H0V60_06790 [Actinobacteria bacterium]|nr:hypothetical protein [Actinomycetota bacterium]